MKVEGIDTLERIVTYHVNSATKASWRSEIVGGDCDMVFMDHPTPEAAFGAAMAWARTSPTRTNEQEQD